MMTWETVREFAERFQIDEFTIVREYLQILFLKYFYASKAAEKIYFKGGTLVHLVLGSFRFSEDLDFTAVEEADRLADRLEGVVKKVNWEAPGATLEIIERKDISLGGRIKYQEEHFKYPLTIRLEFSLRETPLTRQTTLLETPYPIVPYPLIVHLGWEEVLAEKVRALLVRARGRDLFDLWYLLSKGIKLRWNLIEQKLAWYGRSATLDDVITAVQGFDTSMLKKDLGKFLPQGHRTVIKDLKALTVAKLQGG